jgi:beta-glucosidase-like glycosyl hydrolase
MASNNAINGTPKNVNYWLLTELLKDNWKHEAFVVSASPVPRSISKAD